MSAKNNWVTKKVQGALPLISLSKETGTRDFEVVSRDKKLITLKDGSQLTEFISCSYLGLEIDPRVIEGAKRALDDFGMQFACARTRVNNDYSLVLDNMLGEMFNDYFCVTFTSVSITHLGVLPLLASGEMPSFGNLGKKPVFIFDKMVHASIQINRGMLSHFGRVIRADISDINELKNLYLTYELFKNKVYIFTDGLGSMEGHRVTNELIEFSRDNKITLYIDDAHGVSILGQNGSGSVHNMLNEKHFYDYLVCGSLSKAFGCGGGFVVVPTFKDRDFVKNHAPTYTFSGPLQVPVVGAAIESGKIHLSSEIYQLQNKLWENVNLFDSVYSGSLEFPKKSERFFSTVDFVSCTRLGSYIQVMNAVFLSCTRPQYTGTQSA